MKLRDHEKVVAAYQRELKRAKEEARRADQRLTNFYGEMGDKLAQIEKCAEGVALTAPEASAVTVLVVDAAGILENYVQNEPRAK